MKKFLSIVLLIFLSLAIFAACAKDNEHDIIKPPQELNNYEISAKVDIDKKTVIVRLNLNYINKTGAELDSIYFNMYPNAYREENIDKLMLLTERVKAYPNGESFGGIDILHAKNNGEKVRWNILDDEKSLLEIKLKDKLACGARTDITLDFVLTLPQINHRLGISEGVINLGNWYPTLCVFDGEDFFKNGYSVYGDPFYSEVSNYKVEVQVPLGYTAVGSSAGEKQGNTYTFNEYGIRDFALILCNKYRVKSQKINNTMVNYYYYNDKNAEQNFNILKSAFKFFEEKFGEYSYETLSTCQTKFLHGGMEYPNLTYISDSASDEEYQKIIVHELAHMWWYGMVGSNQVRIPFIDEGLTEYSTVMFYEHQGRARQLLMKEYHETLLAYNDIMSGFNKKADIKLNRPLYEYRSSADYVYSTYIKGCIMFDEYRNLVKDKAFFEGLKVYLNDNRYKNVTFNDMIIAFNSTTELDVENYLNSYINKIFQH